MFGRGSAGLAYSIGFTSLSFATPAASNFSFTPPPGATVKNQVVVPGSLKSLVGRAGLGPAGIDLGSLGLGHVGFGSVGAGGHVRLGKGVPGAAIPKQVLAAINARFAQSLPASMTKAQRAKAIKMFDAQIAARVKAGKSNAPLSPLSPRADAPRVIGQDWLSVVAIPANPQVAAAVRALLSAHGPGSARQSPFGNSSSQSASSISASSSPAYGSTLTVHAAPFGPNLAALRALLLATTPVHGSWGSGRLLQTKLLSVLITNKGQILAGAVTPSVLYGDVAADAG